jgi:hypothetical protein
MPNLALVVTKGITVCHDYSIVRTHSKIHQSCTLYNVHVLTVISSKNTCKLLPVKVEAGSLEMNTALEYSTRVVQEGGRRCKKSILNDLVHLTPLRIPLMNPL